MSGVKVENIDSVAVIAINHSDNLKALDSACRRELLSALELVGSSSGTRIVVLTVEGRGFCAGHDLEMDDDSGIHAAARDTYNPVARAIVRMDKPVIAAINGPAIGAGMGFALLCDLRVMADSAFLSCALGKAAPVPDSGALSALLQTVGRARAFDMAVSGRKITAEEAMSLGLVNRVVPADQVCTHAVQWARELARGPALSMALTKRMLVAAAKGPLDTWLDREALSHGVASNNPGFAESAAAVLGERPMEFSPEPVVPIKPLPQRKPDDATCAPLRQILDPIYEEGNVY